MKFLKKINVIALAILLLVSCNKYDFGDLNVNPNNPSSANPQALLTNSIIRSRGLFQISPALYAQYLSQTQYTDVSLYKQTPASFAGLYVNILNELQQAINLNTDEATKNDVISFGSNKNQIAVIEIYKSFVYAKMTDTWGDIPYTEALDSKNITPVYDDQEAIYKGIINTLSTQEAALDVSESSMSDIIYNGNIAKWKKLANSLRIIYSVRLSKRFPNSGEYAAQQFTAAYTDSDGYITTNADNAVFRTTDDYKSPWYDTFDGRNDYAMSNTFVDKLLALNDKRIEYYAATANASGDYVGVPYGLDRVKTLNFVNNNDYSSLSGTFKEKGNPVTYVSAAQTNFAIAEGLSRSWATGDAGAFYNKGIKESYLDSGLSESDHTAYVGGADVVYDAAIAIKQIAIQRWIALFPNGLEAWSSFRRTGFPVLTPAADALNGGTIPKRYLYPADESNENKANLDAAIAKLSGGDEGTSVFWWAKD